MKRLTTIKRVLVYTPFLLLAAIPAMAQPLNGTYTIGGTSPNYTSFYDAAQDLTNRGVSGPVIFNIRPGTYNTNAYGALDNVTGTSATNTITIQPESGRGTVVLNPTGTASNNYVIQINNTDYVTVRDLTLNNAGTSRGRVVTFLGTSSHNTVTRCLITGNANTSSSMNKVRIYADGLSGTDNKVVDDSILTGSYAINWNGDGSTPATNCVFANNRIINPTTGVLFLTNADDCRIENNIVTADPSTTTGGTFYGFYNEFVNNTLIKGNSLTASGISAGDVYALYMYECNNLGSGRMVVRENTFDITSYGYYIGMIVNYCNNYSINKNTISFAEASAMYAPDIYNGSGYGENTTVDSNTITISGSNYANAYVTSAYGGGNNHSFSGNTVSITNTGTSYVYARADGVGKTKANNNTINMATTYDAYMYFSDYGSGDTLNVEGNTVNVTPTSSYSYAFLYLLENSREGVFKNNTFYVKPGSGGYGFSEAYSNSGGPNDKTNNIFSGNKFTFEGTGSYPSVYGTFSQGNNDKIFNNTFLGKGGSTTAQILPFQMYSAYGKMDVYNNTFALTGTSTTSYQYAFYIDNPYKANVNINNNVFYKTSPGGYIISGYEQPTFGATTKFDYNNLYTTGSGFTYINYSTGPANLTAWRAAYGQDKNSISYAPAFVNVAAGNFMPDVTSPNCWSMNGRGVHIADNGTDILGNSRALSPGVGVPDLGAYEFVPDAGVLPPLCDVVPAGAPAAGVTQVYTFGSDTVASITWDAAATTLPATAPDCRQYTGTKPAGLSAINPTSMYFYTDITSSTSTDYDANIYYKEPWIGTIGTEAALRLAKKDGSNPWIGYAFGASGADIARNFIYSPSSPKLNTYGWYTGIDVANNAGTDAIVAPSGKFCPGTYPVTVRIKNNGNNVLNSVKIHWTINGTPGVGSPITYTTPIPVNSGPLNSNAAVINLGNVAFGASANNFKVWTSDPNGVADIVAADDTIKTRLRASLQGTYTVGGTAPDFASVEQAVDDLNELGICGAVTFNIRPGTYTSTKPLDIYTVAGGGTSTTRVTFQSENGSATSVVIAYTGISYDLAHTLRLSGASFISIKNVTISALSPTYSTSMMLEGNCTDDSVVGCIISSNLSANWNSNGVAGRLYNASNTRNLTFQNNTITGYYAFQLEGPYTSFCQNLVIEDNIINTGYYNSLNSVYRYKVNRNTINAVSANFYSGLQISNYNQGPADNNFEVIGNKITATSGYGLYLNYPNGSYPNNPPSDRSIVANNVISVSGTNGYGALYIYNPARVDILNNSVNVTNTNASCWAGYIQTYGYPHEDNTVKNNVFANTGGGKAYYLGMYDGYSDFNNVYATASSKYDGFYGSFTTFPAFRSALSSNGWEQNSIAYAPGFTSATDLRPDPSNPNSWSLNGRGEQLLESAEDIDGNPRPTVLADGVPDIGAYEFEPTSLPPAAVATPAVAAPGVTQRFTFGDQKVATVKWNTAMAITTPLVVRQYSGRIPPANFTTISPNHQYFYTTMTPTASGVTYDFDLTLNYLDTWMGTMPSEPDMKLAHQLGSSPWISYNEANSSTDDSKNEINAAGVTSFGTFTGIEDGINFSALIKRDPNDPPIICTGRSVTLNASPVSGGSTTYTYEWKRNGVTIPGANTSSLVVTMGGDYTVTITGTQSATSLPEAIIVVAPPMALVAANGPLTFCTGGALTLTSTSPSNVTAHQWQLNGADVPGATDTTFDLSTAGTYRLIVNNAGCADTSAPVVVNAGPIAVNLGADITACEVKNKPFILDAGYPGAKYTWSTGDTTQTIEVYKSGSYSVQVDAGPNCNGSDAVNVTVKPLPSATGINTIRTNNTYTFSPAGALNTTKLLWIFGDGTTNTANTVIKTFDGNMTVKLVVYNDCGTDTIQMMQWGTGITKTENGSINASLYPNPATEKTLLSVDGAKIEDVTILNAVGQVVYRATLDGKSATIELPVNNLAAGRYIVRATTTEGIISKPLNVQR